MVLVPILEDHVLGHYSHLTNCNKTVKVSDPKVLGASKWISHSKKTEKPDELSNVLPLKFVTLYRRQGSRPSPCKRNAKNQNGCLRRPYK